MFFIVSKTLAFLALPSNLLFILALFGFALLATRYRRAGRRLATVGLVLLAVIGFSPIGHLLLRVLDHRFPRWDAARGAPDGIVVLGGAISPDASQDSSEPVVGGSAGRIFALAKLARQFPSARIVYTGGNSDLIPNGPAEAMFVAPLLDQFGVARDRVLLESGSRNTAENATMTRDLVKPKTGERWLLVTTAWHMPRAIGCFRRAGFNVEAYPVDRDSRSIAAALTPSRTFAGGLHQTDQAVHEWIGLVAYWLSGRTSELLPGPDVK
jgi:uncharacterized SAM-binding protein YcdF (DUF218 family)